MKWLIFIPLAIILADDPPKCPKCIPDSTKKKVLAQQQLVQNDIDTIKTDLDELIQKLDSLNGKKKSPRH